MADYLTVLTDSKPLQLVLYLQLLSFEFVNKSSVWQRSSLFFDQDMFDFCVLAAKSFVPRILTHGQTSIRVQEEGILRLPNRLF